jgi:hypothetical protein
VTTDRVLDAFLYPIALVTEAKYITWTLLFAALIWLLVRRVMQLSGVAFVPSMVAWMLILALGCITAFCTLALFLLTPRGDEYYRVVIAFLGSLPFVIGAVICLVLKPSPA